MTDITNEQRAAWLRLSDAPGATDKPGATVKSDAALVAPLLPSELTNPQPALPTEPDYYISDELSTVCMLRHTGEWLRFGDGKPAHREFVLDSAPFTRLVPERPQITREQVQTLVTQWYDHGSNGRLADGILALVNGSADD
jgi:hypothetical protein